MKKGIKHLIYDNYDMLDNDDEIKKGIVDNQDIPIEDITEEMIQEEKNFLYDLYYNDELGNLDIELDGRIIAIADLGLWDGRVSGYKIGENNLNEIMKMGNEDYITVYSDGFNIRKDSSHHDGTNHLLFRMVREDRNIENFTSMVYSGKPISKGILNYYTKSVEKNVRSIFGW
jgi:hypothetical protein